MARDPETIPPASESGRFLPPDEPDDSVNDIEVLLSRAADGELTAEEEQLLKQYVADDPSKLSGLRKAIKLSQELDEVLGDMDLAEGMHREKELPKLKPTAPTFELIPYLRWWMLAGTLLFWTGEGLFRFINLMTGHAGPDIIPAYSDRWPYMIADWALTLFGLACVFFAGRMAAVDGAMMARLTGGGFKVSRTECLIIQAVGVAITIFGCVLWHMLLQPVLPAILPWR